MSTSGFGHGEAVVVGCGRYRFVNSNDDGDFVDGNGRFLCHQSINF